MALSFRKQVGRFLASCLDAWNEVRPPKDDRERCLGQSISLPEEESLSAPGAIDLSREENLNLV